MRLDFFEISVVTDAKNLLSALQVTQLKIPAENNFIVHLMWLKDKVMTGVIDALIWTDTRDMTADGHTKGSIKVTALHALMDGNRRIEHEREILRLHKLTPCCPSQARSSGAAGTPSRTGHPQRRRQAPRRPAKTLLLALLASMATSAKSNIVLGPCDNPFALLGMRRTSIEAALTMDNKDFVRAYRMASKVLHPDQVKDQNDEKLKAMMSEQFCKAALAKELLVVPTGNREAKERRNTYIRRFLWTEQ